MLSVDTDESEDEGSPESPALHQAPSDHQSFVFGYRSADVDLRKLHPLPSQIPFIWQIYQENVEPLLKMLHIPTMDKLIKNMRRNIDDLRPGNEALLFAIYYAAITSMEEDEVSRS
jgi:hypothetical protein